MIGRYLCTLLFLTFFAITANAQPNTTDATLRSMIMNVDSFLRRAPAEHIYVHTDKPYYTNTDTIWMKAYVMDGALRYSKQSGVMYAELVNDTGRVVLQQSMPIYLGVNWGQMALDSIWIAEGSYTLRAYTNWMQNTGPASFYTQQLYISSTRSNMWQINAGVSLVGDSVRAGLQLFEADGNPVRWRHMQISLTEGNKTRFRERIQTDLEGKINLKFTLPKNADASRLTLIARERDKATARGQMVIPLKVSRPTYTDVQFMPEGGQLVAGIPTKVGVKATGEDGLGVNVRGVVLDKSKKLVAEFGATDRGMGSFLFMPEAGEIYTAQVSLKDGAKKLYPFPQVKEAGVVLNIRNVYQDSVININARASKGLLGAYALIGQAGGVLCYGSIVHFTDNAILVKTGIPKSKLPSGIVRFTLLTAEGRPVAERMVFIDHKDQLNISLTTDKGAATTSDSLSLSIKVTDHFNNPVQGSFSLSVTDDGLVKTDSLNSSDIRSHLLLAAGLRGHIEQPAWYFRSQSEQTHNALDNLMLTQGWVGYDWKMIFNTKSSMLKYRAEPEFAVTGQIKRLNKPQANMPVLLISTKKPTLFMDTVTDQYGRFTFHNLPQFDTAAFVIEAKDKKGKFFNAIIEPDEFVAPDTKGLPVPVLRPSYVNADSTLLNFYKNTITYQKKLNDIKMPVTGNVLQEVRISAKRTIKDSHNLNGSGNANQILDVEDIRKAGKKLTLLDLLYAKVKGFVPYKMYGRIIRFIIDGVEVAFFYNPEVDGDYRRYLDFVLNNIEADDVKGLEVMYTERYISSYTSRYDDEFMLQPSYKWPAYIEVTTWSGNGFFARKNYSLAIVRPVPVSWPAEFYRPKYPVKDDVLYNLRPTISWMPNIVTNAEGRAEVSFFTKSKKASYTIIVQGADLEGGVGSAVKHIKVE